MIQGQKLVDWIAGRLERHWQLVVAGVCVVYLAACWAVSATKLLWFDELATYYPAALPTIADLIRFFFEGLDVHTPVSALVERASLTLLGVNHLGMRAPYILGYLLFCLCLFRFVALRTGPLWGMLAMSVPLVAPTIYYATEMRPYPILMGLSALAAVCWQEASEGRRRAVMIPLLWFTLTASVSLHYYTVFVLVPFGVAEIVRWRSRGRPDWPMWLAIASAPAILLTFLPAIAKAKAAYASGIWSRPSPGQIEETYRFLLALAFPPAIIALVVWMVLHLWVRNTSTPGRVPDPAVVPSPIPTAERVLIAFWALMPVYVVPASYLAGGYVPRYALSCFAGVVLYLVMLIWRASAGSRLPAMVGFLVLFGWFCLKSPGVVRKNLAGTGGYPFRTSQPFSTRSWMPLLDASPLPVVVSPAVFFLQFQHYAPESMRGRIRYLASRKYAMELEGMDTGDTNLTMFARMLPVPISSYDEFVRENKRFLLIAETTNPTWVIEKLKSDGATLILRNRQDTFFLFEAVLPE
ncbi:MAG: hypothetical protein JNL98_03255 [Bryobacterales bacterium]|nr:hypothetical protein [Bryobacterales bacterium]